MTDREKLIELIFNGARCLQPEPYETCNGCKYEKDSRCYLSRLADYLLSNGVTIADKTAAVEKPQWIPVTERLPEGECIAFGYQGEMIMGYLGIEAMGGETLYYAENEGEYLYYVTHWMPLPEPPKEVEENA